MFAAFTLSACSLFGVRDGYEQPPYTVVQTLGEDVEIRRYPPRLAAQATVEADDQDDGTNAAFRLLFDYITGANEPNAEIAMTSPVAVDRAGKGSADGAEITMTTPVETSAEDGRVTMRFFLPAGYSATDVPRPSDDRVRILELPEETVAALTYAGARDGERAAAQQASLRAALEESGAWRPAGAAVSYYYDPPWTLPWFRRNEAVVPVERD